MTNSAPLDRRTHAYRPDLADVALANLVQADRYVEPVIRQCVRGVLPLFGAPRFDASLVSQVRYGEFLDVFEVRDDGFAWVQNRMDHYVGYMPYDGAFSEEIADLSNRVIEFKTFVYPEPSMKTAPIDELTLGSYVRPLRAEGNYFEIASGGYVYNQHIAAVADSCAPDYVFTAGRLLHVPYLWGGRTPNGIDCSGLVQLALQMANIDVPRDSDQQKEAFGQALPCHWRDMAWKRGDIIFLKGQDETSHIGIMTGADHIIHATAFFMRVVTEPLTNLIERGYEITGIGKPGI